MLSLIWVWKNKGSIGEFELTIWLLSNLTPEKDRFHAQCHHLSLHLLFSDSPFEVSIWIMLFFQNYLFMKVISYLLSNDDQIIKKLPHMAINFIRCYHTIILVQLLVTSRSCVLIMYTGKPKQIKVWLQNHTFQLGCIAQR